MKIVYQFSQDFQTNYFAISHWTLYCSSLVTPKYLLNNLKKGDKTFAFLKDIHYDLKIQNSSSYQIILRPNYDQISSAIL